MSDFPSPALRRFASEGRHALWAGARARRGNVGLIVALVLPALAVLTLGATDVAFIMGDRGKMRSIAEAAALSGARNLSIAMSESDAKAHAEAMAAGMVEEWRAAPQINVTVSIQRLQKDNAKAVRVALDARRPSFFGDLLPPGGWRYGDAATASSLGSKPLCVLAFNGDALKRFELRDSPEIRAPECLVHSNGDVEVKGGSIVAGQTQAVRSATGDITPAPITDAPPIADPFKDLDFAPSDLPCVKDLNSIKLAAMSTGSITLPAGTHCGAIDVSGDAVVQLAPGDHRFLLGSLTMRGASRLQGRDVALIFDRTWQTKFKENAQIDLQGRDSGPLAGFVILADRANSKPFEIDSTHVERLEGVIYVPGAELRVSGKSDVARQSNWTVIVAQSLRMSGNPHLYLNTDYRGSDLAPPVGVGNRRDGVRLID